MSAARASVVYRESCDRDARIAVAARGALVVIAVPGAEIALTTDQSEQLCAELLRARNIVNTRHPGGAS